jgi:tetratricopeptide (TPR) repeat protein
VYKAKLFKCFPYPEKRKFLSASAFDQNKNLKEIIMEKLIEFLSNYWLIITIITSTICSAITAVFFQRISALRKEKMEVLNEENIKLKKEIQSIEFRKNAIEDEEMVFSLLNILTQNAKPAISNKLETLILNAKEELSHKFKTKMHCAEKEDEQFTIRKLKGLFYLFKEDLKTSIKYYIDLIQQYPEDAEFLRTLGIIHMHQAQFDEALSCFTGCLSKKQHLNPIFVYNNIGQVYQYKNDLKSADNYYNKAINFQSENDFYKYLPYYNIGILNYQLHNYVKEKESYETALKYNNSHYKSYYNLACIFCEEGNVKEALRCFKKAYCLNSLEIGIMAENDNDIELIKQHPEIRELLDPSVTFAQIFLTDEQKRFKIK